MILDFPIKDHLIIIFKFQPKYYFFIADLGLYLRLLLQFDEIFEQPDPKEDLKTLVDPSLEDDYSIDSVYKVSTCFRVNYYKHCAWKKGYLKFFSHLLLVSSLQI